MPRSTRQTASAASGGGHGRRRRPASLDDDDDDEGEFEFEGGSQGETGGRTKGGGRRVVDLHADDDEEEAEEPDDDVEAAEVAKGGRKTGGGGRRRTPSSSSQTAASRSTRPTSSPPTEDDDKDEGDDLDGANYETALGLTLSSQLPEGSGNGTTRRSGGTTGAGAPSSSQVWDHPETDSERRQWSALPSDTRHQIVSDLFRVLLFKAHAGEPIDRIVCLKDIAGLPPRDKLAASAAFRAAQHLLHDLWGYELRRIPDWMRRVDGISHKAKDKHYYYAINAVGDETGQHSLALHSIHSDDMIDKALLMVVLALAYCKGDPKGDGSRWIRDVDLFHYLHELDDALPSEPPAPGSRNKKRSLTAESQLSQTQSSLASSGSGGGGNDSPDVDATLERLVQRGYLLRRPTHAGGATAAATTTTGGADTGGGEGGGVKYSMGPRSALEVGRRQVVYFCAEVLGRAEPDAAMLQELNDDDEEEDDEEEGENDGHGAVSVVPAH